MLQITLKEFWVLDNEEEILPYIEALQNLLNSKEAIEPSKIDVKTWLCILRGFSMFNSMQVLYHLNQKAPGIKERFARISEASIMPNTNPGIANNSSEEKNAASLFLRRYLFINRTQLVPRIFSKNRVKLVLKSIGNDKNITPFVLFQRIAKNLGCKFSYKGKFIPYSKVFEFGGFLPKIIENANLLSKATVGYGVGSEYSDDKKTVYLSPKFPLGYLALFVADIIEQLIDRTNFAKLFLVDVEVLELSKLNLVVMLDELYGQSEDSNEILFKYKFVGDAYLSKDFSELYKLDLQELKESLAKLNILCNCAGNDTANKSADNFIKDIKKAVSYYPYETFLYKDQYKRRVIKAISDISEEEPQELKQLLSKHELEPIEDFDYKNLDKYKIPDLPNLPRLPDLED